MEYLLDTNVLIHYLKEDKSVVRQLRQTGPDRCSISEITLAELFYGIEKGKQGNRGWLLVNSILAHFKVIPILESLRLFAFEKARLENRGTKLEDFDLLIGYTALQNGMTLVANNTKHFSRIDGLKLEDWKETNELG